MTTSLIYSQIPLIRKLRGPQKALSIMWLDEIFQGQYLPSLSIIYVAIHKDLEKLPSSGPKRLQNRYQERLDTYLSYPSF